ncbi:biliverdin-producing heme oxygenase [Nakamurella silvestris]|nr:biliverdin-producing heme oxygenase [Nakamurella silvestris]
MTRNESSPHPVATRRPLPESDEANTFSALIRQRTWGNHAQAEGEGFIHALFRGELTLADYAAMTTAHYFIYQALEATAGPLAEDPIAGPLIHQGLNREDALAKDLASLLGAGWQQHITPSPATAAYVARIKTPALDDANAAARHYIAHAYTRYMGDLSGGQMIRKRLVNHFGFIESDRVAFYEFADLGPLGAFKDTYRAALDALPLDEVEQEALITEVVEAYRLNVALFDELEVQRQAAM